MLRMVFYAVLVVMALILLGMLGIVAYFVWHDWRPQLARDLPPIRTEAEIVFAERVRAKFPVGTSATDLKRELKAQGFDLDQGLAKFVRGGFPCALYWYVKWRVDENDQLTHIEGIYYSVCV